MPPIENKSKNQNLPTDRNGKTYWRSLNQLADTEEFREFVKREIPNRAFEMLDGSSRRNFLKLMAASFALAGFSGCYDNRNWPWWPEEKIAPYAFRPEGRIPGMPEYYATSYEIGGVANGLLMTSYDGRPIKVEGNPSHPVSQGSTTAIQQALVLELYDPDRSQDIFQKQNGSTFSRSWDDFVEFANDHFASQKQNRGQTLAFLSEQTSSPTVTRLRQNIQQAYPRSKWHTYEPINQDNEIEGTRLALGNPLRVHPHLDKAKVIVCLDADLFVKHPASQKLARDFASGRNPHLKENTNRLYAVESNYSSTGAMADHRLPLESSKVLPFAVALATEIFNQAEFSIPSQVAALRNQLHQEHTEDLPQEFIAALAKDLVEHRGQCLIAVGSHQPPAVHALACALNTLLGANDETVSYSQVIDDTNHLESIQTLAESLRNGNVDTLVIIGGNPAYDAPSDLGMAELIENVDTTIHLSLYHNETTELCKWHVPKAHTFESWGDSRAYDGTLCMTQPLMYPLYDGKTTAEFLSVLHDENYPNNYELVRETFRNLTGSSNFEKRWNQAIQKGVVADSSDLNFPVSLSGSRVVQAVNDHLSRYSKPTFENLELVFTQDPKLYDGRYANSGWLQELPEFITKLCWDNVALISYDTAQQLGIHQGELVTLQTENRSLEMAAYILPGHADHSITVALGYGRPRAGRVGNVVGFNTYTLRTSQAMDIATGFTLEPTGTSYPLAETQDHHLIETVGREETQARIPDLVKEATVDEYLENENVIHEYHGHHPPIKSLWPEWEYRDNKWGMSIDLNSCVGCNSCVTACQAENNIPIVGKQEVILGREMHWLRIDRYFKGEVQNPEVAHQPMMCVHCETAPCEQVCPVNATVHSHDGLNLMVYNRCIGTRYCSNNCPFKVRRFNYFYYHKNLSETHKMVHNPEVSVRSRGVMEKCTYCVQRIENTRIQAKNEKRPIRDGEIQTACQQACPTNAIVFGDLNNKESQVAKLHQEHLAYVMLKYLNIKPRTAYQARLKNPNSELVTEESAHESTHSSH